MQAVLTQYKYVDPSPSTHRAQADFPQRMFVGAAEQDKERNESCITCMPILRLSTCDPKCLPGRVPAARACGRRGAAQGALSERCTAPMLASRLPNPKNATNSARRRSSRSACLWARWSRTRSALRAAPGLSWHPGSRETLSKPCMLRAQAEFPQRVFVGAVEQDKERNESCIDSTLPSFANVRVVAIPHTASKGPTYGRYLAGTVFRGETFYMQLDSHTQLAPKWDSKLIAMLDTCDSPKPVRQELPPLLASRCYCDKERGASDGWHAFKTQGAQAQSFSACSCSACSPVLPSGHAGRR